MSSTYSYTFTVTDIGRVFDQVRADVHMAAQSTGCWTEGFVDRLLSDVKRYAQKGYLDLLAIYLVDSAGTPIRAATYRVSHSAETWSATRPGNMLWPRGLGNLRATISLNSKWRDLSTAEQLEFEKAMELEWPATSTQDLGFPGLSGAFDRNYVSNSYGVEKKSFK